MKNIVVRKLFLAKRPKKIVKKINIKKYLLYFQKRKKRNRRKPRRKSRKLQKNEPKSFMIV